MCALLSVLTCGLYLPWWFVRTFKKPPLYRVAIDEYGTESWTQHPISVAQRIQCVVGLVALLWWLGVFVPQAMQVLSAFGHAR
jgi:hypothetical protein